MTNRSHTRRLLLVRSGLLLVIGGALAFCAPAQPHPRLKREEYKHEVEKLEDVWRQAQLNADAATMDKLLSDDYVGISMNGQVVTKMQQLDRIRNRQLVMTKIDLDDVKVKLIGTTAIVTSRAEVEGTNEGVSVLGTYRYTRIYSRSPSGDWKITNFEATRVGPPPAAPHAGRHSPESPHGPGTNGSGTNGPPS
jgi:ketosteroid isomerase-like protein